MGRRWTIAAVTGMLFFGLCVPAVRAESPPPPPKPEPVQASANDGPFIDLDRNHWAYMAAFKLREAGVIAVDPTGRFRPTDPVTRAELFKMVLAARRIQADTKCEGLFADVSCSAWYAPTAEMAYRLHIAEGRGNRQLDPQGAVTRQELFTILVRALGKRWDASSLGWPEINNRLSGLKDEDDIAYWAQPSVAWALGEGLASPADGYFRPGALTTRAEAAVAIGRILLTPEQTPVVEVDGKKVYFAQAREDMIASMYATGEPGVGTMTYTGLTVRVGSIAVDPKVIPLGRLLFVEGYGYGVAADIGGAIKGNRVDLYTTDYHEAAVRFGMQPRRVWVLP